MVFRLGQKVVRVGYDTDRDMWVKFYNEMGGFNYPQLGEVVTIKTINDWPTGTILTFYEHDNSRHAGTSRSRLEPGFGAEHFRPVTERDTDISVFKEMLKPILADVLGEQT